MRGGNPTGYTAAEAGRSFAALLEILPGTIRSDDLTRHRQRADSQILLSRPLL